jgi:hypothetical protein
MKDREHNGQKFQDNKRFNQKTHINEGRRTQWPKFEDTKGLIRRHKSMKDREHNGQKFEDTKRFNQKTQIDEGQRTQWPKV